LRQSGGLPAAQEIETMHVQIDRLREQSNWLGREVKSLRDALEVSAAGTREVAEMLGSFDVAFIKATLLQHGTLLQAFVDEARQRQAKFDAAQAGIQQRLDAFVSLSRDVERLTAQLRAIESLPQEVEKITSHFNAAPYLSNPDALQITDDSGRQAIGYRAPASRPVAEDNYIAFENLFRGPEELIRKRQRIYLAELRGHEPVVDLGCGRGEMLDLLKEANIAASGVDNDAGMVRHTTGKGHQVEKRDLLDYLTAQPDGSIGALFSAQVIEHLSFEQLLQFLTLAIRKLKPGGVLIAETVNPHSHRALKTFYVDLTHNKPIFPEVLVALCRQFRYAEAVVRFPCGEGTFEHDRLWEGEYAVIARTPAAASPPPV
jgi:2-polyprenyl-3-methyl-5-hydroxy-6-metoxy-1,4-benzoquinol methylase